jgi:glutamate-1-semialdehyde 2,1-aminomutase
MSMRRRPRTEEIFRRGERVLPGGVNSPVRAFGAVGGLPVVVERAAGSRLWDVDGREYIDYVCSWGALIAGHVRPEVQKAIAEQAAKGTSYGMTSPLEVELAERIAAFVPSMEMMRFVNSGTEATMSAVRLARAFTGRNLIVKFEGCYHGHADGFLSEAGSGLATLGISSSPGVPEEFARLTLNVPYNDYRAVERLFFEQSGRIAAVIVEPVAANMGVVAPEAEFLPRLRALTAQEGALLIFDEVITGFRLGPGGAQEAFGVRPDLSTFGKIIGGGLPVAAYGGRREIMEHVAPLGKMYQAGTLSGNPLAMRAGLEMMKLVARPGFYEELGEKTNLLAHGLRAVLRETGLTCTVNAVGSLLTMFFATGPVRDYASAKESDTVKYAAFFHEMLSRAVLLAPSQYEALFVSTAHTDEDIDRTIEAARASLEAISGGTPAA